MEIKSLKNIPADQLYAAFARAFAEYEVQIGEDEFRIMLKRRGFRPDLSFAAFVGDHPVAFTLNGTGLFHGIPTAYDTGTGTWSEYRGQGLASRIFNHAVPYLKAYGIKQYLLEVLQHNEKAVSVYKNLGFEVVRELNYFVQRTDEIDNAPEDTAPGFEIRQTEMSGLQSFSGFHDFHPSWQNSCDSLLRAVDCFVCFVALVGGKCVGYCVFDPTSGDVAQIAVDRQYRRKGIASSLLKKAAGCNTNERIKVVNTDVAYDPITHFLKARNIPVRGKQFEMIKRL